MTSNILSCSCSKLTVVAYDESVQCLKFSRLECACNTSIYRELLHRSIGRLDWNGYQREGENQKKISTTRESAVSYILKGRQPVWAVKRYSNRRLLGRHPIIPRVVRKFGWLPTPSATLICTIREGRIRPHPHVKSSLTGCNSLVILIANYFGDGMLFGARQVIL